MSLPTAGPSAHALPVATIRSRTRTGPTCGLCARSAMPGEIDRQGSRHALLAAADAQSRRPGCLHSAAACKKLAAAVQATGTSLTGLYGVGPVVAAVVIGDVRDVSRFSGRDHFAACTGTAPIEVSSGPRKIYRLSRGGNRRLNHATHMAAVTQIGHRHSQGRAYYDKKLAEGKTPKEALRSLKRQISNAIFACLQANARRAATDRSVPRHYRQIPNRHIAQSRRAPLSVTSRRGHPPSNGHPGGGMAAAPTTPHAHDSGSGRGVSQYVTNPGRRPRRGHHEER